MLIKLWKRGIKKDGVGTKCRSHRKREKVIKKKARTKCRSHPKGEKVIKKKGPEQSVDQIVDKKRGKNKV